MSISALGFLIFLIPVLLIYYALPKAGKPWVLLTASLGFIATYDLRAILFLIFTSGTIWACGRAMEKSRHKRGLLLLTMGVNLMILVGLKYIAPYALRDTGMLGRLFAPIGLSYYTLQAISYLMDVYWKRISPEQKYSRVLLFLCYFPQILQGPINRYQALSQEIYGKNHTFQVRNLKFGAQLMLWGYFKIFVIGNRIAKDIPAAFGGEVYGFAALAGLILFGIELYCNFSGGIDVVRGVSQCLDIDLPDNFRQPYFSRSLGEFWRRWHITLGSFMKDYVFYPFSMSKGMSKLKKKLKKQLPRKTANRIAMAIANLFVFLLVGIWHGTGTNYLLWGLYNGVILAFSELMAERYAAMKTRLHIQEASPLWNGFCIGRTFLIVTLGWATDCAVTAAGSLTILRNMLYVGRTNFSALGLSGTGWALTLFGTGILFLVSLAHEKGHSIRECMDRQNLFIQCLFWIALIQLIGLLGKSGINGGLMYAAF